MHTNNLVVNHSTAGKAVEGIAELLPHFHRKATTTLIVESVDSIDTGAFVIAAQEKEILRVFNLVGKEKADYFQ